MLTIANLATQDKYVDALTLGPVPTCRQIKYVVANKAVLARIWPKLKSGTIPAQTDELLITPETNLITDAIGIQFRSALPGVPAQVIAQLIEPGDPLFGSGTPFSATISGGGGIQPGVSSVQIQKNGALIAAEPTLDFEDAGAFIWAVADDAVNQRVKVTPPRIVTGKIHGANGAIMQGTGFTCVRTAVGTYQITFNPVFAAAPVVFVDSTLLNPALNSFATADAINAGDCRINSVSAGATTDGADLIFMALAMG